MKLLVNTKELANLIVKKAKRKGMSLKALSADSNYAFAQSTVSHWLHDRPITHLEKDSLRTITKFLHVPMKRFILNKDDEVVKKAKRPSKVTITKKTVAKSTKTVKQETVAKPVKETKVPKQAKAHKVAKQAKSTKKPKNKVTPQTFTQVLKNESDKPKKRVYKSKTPRQSQTLITIEKPFVNMSDYEIIQAIIVPVVKQLNTDLSHCLQEMLFDLTHDVEIFNFSVDTDTLLLGELRIYLSDTMKKRYGVKSLSFEIVLTKNRLALYYVPFKSTDNVASALNVIIDNLLRHYNHLPFVPSGIKRTDSNYGVAFTRKGNNYYHSLIN